MTNPEGCPSSSVPISVIEHAVNGVPVLRTSTAGLDTAAAAPAGRGASSHEVVRDRLARLRLLAGSVLGVECLLLALRLHPGGGSPFAAPSGPAEWTAVICGIAGIWLVPGLWLSAVMMRTGPGPVAWLATRIGTTLAWYALVGPVVHELGRGARVTAGGIVGATAAATAAVCLGVALGLLRRPANPRLRIMVAAVVGGVCAQTAIWLWMRLWTYDMYFGHIRRLDLLIVLACALLTCVGTHSRPELPSVRTARHIRKILVSLSGSEFPAFVTSLIAITAVALLAICSRWSPVQRMPSALSVEQVPAPADADLAFALTAIGPEGSAMMQRAFFTASDDTGRPVGVRTRLVVGDRTADWATLLVVLDPRSRPVLCGPHPARHRTGRAGQARHARPGLGRAHPGHHPGEVVRPMTRARTHKPGRGLLGNSFALLAMTHITSLLGYRVLDGVCTPCLRQRDRDGQHGDLGDDPGRHPRCRRVRPVAHRAAAGGGP